MTICQDRVKYIYDKSEFGIEWMRYEEYRNLPEIVKVISHIAFKADDIYEAIKGKKAIIEPNILFDSAILTAV